MTGTFPLNTRLTDYLFPYKTNKRVGRDNIKNRSSVPESQPKGSNVLYTQIRFPSKDNFTIDNIHYKSIILNELHLYY